MDAVQNFKCARCGNCCRWPGYVRISVEETAQIAAFLGITVQSFTDEYTVLTSDRRGLSLKERNDRQCVFYEEPPPTCRIETVKPLQCRNFPVKWNFEGWEKECKGSGSEQI
ncbi:MAG: YkgJ family cysteine cluster protein [Lentisphaerota bacterium]